MVIIIFIINISIIIAIFVSGPGYDLLICVISAGFRQEQFAQGYPPFWHHLTICFSAFLK